MRLACCAARVAERGGAQSRGLRTPPGHPFTLAVASVRKSIDDEDEVLLAPRSLHARDHVGGAQYANTLLMPLETLATVEETVVRDKAVESLNKVAGQLSSEHVLEYFVPLIRRLRRRRLVHVADLGVRAAGGGVRSGAAATKEELRSSFAPPLPRRHVHGGGAASSPRQPPRRSTRRTQRCSARTCHRDSALSSDRTCGCSPSRIASPSASSCRPCTTHPVLRSSRRVAGQVVARALLVAEHFCELVELVGGG